MNLERLLKFKGTILVTGETGSGKSFWCHKFALKREKVLSRILTIDLASLADNLVESELFGHSRGAFTGAITKRVGLCEKIDDGTLILDEIGELSLDAQKKLLTLLERKVFRPVGSNQEVDFKGQIIAATNKNLYEMVKAGKFREDLYYRLNVFHYHIPPFRTLQIDKKKKIVREIIIKLMNTYKLKQLPTFSSSAKEFFGQAHWPGNIRQIAHLLEYIMVMHEGEVITVTLLQDILQGQGQEEKDDMEFNYRIGEISFHCAKAKFEKGYIENALRYSGGYINRTAILTGMSKSTLISKIRQLDINVLKYKNMSKMEKIAA